MTSLEPNVVIEFDTSSENCQLIKKIIKEQGVLTCRDTFPINYLPWCLQNFTNGYIIVGKKSPNTSNRGESSKYILKAFTLFVYDILGNTIEGRILCSRESYKNDRLGVIMLDCIKEFCINHSITEWNIRSLPVEKLIRYYEDYGFVRGEKIFDKKGIFKVQKMKMVDFGEENIEEEYEEYEKSL